MSLQQQLVQLTGWRLELIGSIEKNETDFEAYIDSWYENNADMKSLVSFRGTINGSRQIYEKYCSAKVFAFLSRYESYGIAAAEVAVCGCFIIAADIPSINRRRVNAGIVILLILYCVLVKIFYVIEDNTFFDTLEYCSPLIRIVPFAIGILICDIFFMDEYEKREDTGTVLYPVGGIVD